MSLTPPPHRPDDLIEQLLAAARRGSREALGRLLIACRRYLLKVANRGLDSDLQAKEGASDVVQDTLLDAHRAFPRFEGTTEKELLNWLVAILQHNVANSRRRHFFTAKRDATREVSLDDSVANAGLKQSLQADDDSPSSLVVRQEQNTSLNQSMQRLREPYRGVLLMRHKEGLSWDAIGRRLKRSPEAARKLWMRAVEKLQRDIDATG
jgi:RNA polymerase sigma-70 factor (ECF subfamily)